MSSLTTNEKGGLLWITGVLIHPRYCKHQVKWLLESLAFHENGIEALAKKTKENP